MANQQVLDELFQALADPTRRSVLEQLGTGPASTSELASHFEMALPSFTRHLDVLDRCGLVTSQKEGRVRTYQLLPAGLEPAEHWLTTQHRLWTRRLDQLDSLLTAIGLTDPEETS
ncbi:MAG TPA: metalloregulator ArsR/SmtB family transcription factor [Acidimicrobiales bacterium]